MGKRSNGEGSISLRSDGRYMVRWTDHEGRRRTAYAPSRADAATKLREALTHVADGVASVESADSLKAVGTAWEGTALTRQGISASSLKLYAGVLRLHVYPTVGAMRLRDIRPAHVAGVLAAMEGKGLSGAYRSTARRAMSNIFRTAVEDGLIRTNPVRSVKAPPPDRVAKVVPTREQVVAMIEAAPDARARALICVLAYTGARVGEALALTWGDWDGAGTLRVRYGKGGRSRAVPVTATLAAELRTWRAAQAAERLASVWWDGSVDYLLSSSVGTQWDDHNARRHAFRPAADAACPGATPHSMRHAAATLLLEERVPMRVVSELLGHSSMKLTSQTYSHVSALLAAEAGAALEQALSPGQVTGSI